MPAEHAFLGDVLDRGGPATLADVVGEPLRVEGVAREEVQALLLHFTGGLALYASELDFQEYLRASAR